ncbi:MAG: chemotaxis protein CheA, partial [Alkaliphilus sp.]|nr:chemotaxis protein CheA [Alkaliphilus sp.]
NEIINTGEEGTLDVHNIIIKLKSPLSYKNGNIDLSSSTSEKKNIGIEIEEFSKNAIIEAISEGYKAYKILVQLNQNCMLKSARAFIVFNLLERDGEIIKSYPPVEDIEDEKFENSFEIIVISKLETKEITDSLLSISEIETVIVQEVENLEFGEVIDSNKIENQLIEKITVEDNEHEMEDNNDKKSNASKKPKIGKTVRVDIDRLDNLMNLVSELIIIKTRLEDIDGSGKRDTMNEAIEYLERITTSLHDAVMKVRMVSIERVFNRFPRMVRDLSKELGKELSLYMSGEETEVDRTVIDEIGDPLIHLIRNAIDHGIEDPSIRKKLGKPEEGTVKLVAYPDGNSVVIEVEDNGQGINIDKVKAKAVEKRLITKEYAEGMDNKEAVQLLFKPGFSTIEKISDISGRGVGLDVVKTKIESLGGVVEIESIKNVGSTFIIRLPLTLAIIQALLVNIGTEKYAIPLNSIKEIITIEKASIRKIQKQEVILFRNSTLPIIRMSNIFEIEHLDNESEEMTVVVVKKGDKTAGFVVDNLIGQQEIVIKSLGKFLSGIKVIAGATILGNGQIALIVDTNSLF